MDVQMSPAAVGLYRMFGLFPIGDTPRFTGAWWHHVSLESKKRWYNKYGGFDSEIGWGYYLDTLRERMDRMHRLHKDPKARVTTEFRPETSREEHIPIIDAIVNDSEGKYQVNVPNKGALEGFAEDVVVEVPRVANGTRVQSIHVGTIPKHLMLHIKRTQVIPMEMGLEAYLTGDRRVILNQDLRTSRKGP